MRDTEKKLNAMSASQVHAGGARHVDTYTPTIGHDMCQPAGQRAMAAAVERAVSCGVHGG
ncbi:hypothetical protein [Streptomyces sp. NBC_00445]|uniref:hypothetical protein n=1 Tax=Streptomyces sp. NBC_00445 TaxID=2975745 RepID=UPI002E239E6C